MHACIPRLAKEVNLLYLVRNSFFLKARRCNPHYSSLKLSSKVMKGIEDPINQVQYCSVVIKVGFPAWEVCWYLSTPSIRDFKRENVDTRDTLLQYYLPTITVLFCSILYVLTSHGANSIDYCF